MTSLPATPRAALTAEAEAAASLQAGHLADALTHAERAVRLAGGTSRIWVTYAVALSALGRASDALAAYERALGLPEPPVEAYYGLGCVLDSLGRHTQAYACLERVLVMDPDYAEAACQLGRMRLRDHRHREAIDAFQQALAVDPDFTAAGLGLCRSLQATGAGAAAEAEWARLRAPESDDAELRCAFAEYLLGQDRHREAIEVLRGAIRLAPGNADLYRRLGLALAEIGELAEAVALLEAALARRPQAGTYRELTNLRRTRPGDPTLEGLRRLAAEENSLSPAERVDLHFALGRALSDTGDPARGWEHYRRANALHRPTIHYDEPATRRLFERIRTAFAALPRPRTATTDGRPPVTPVFIVGMPRSGSTLTEQILASHPAVRALGETRAFGLAIEALSPQFIYPESALNLRARDLEMLARHYLESALREGYGSAEATRPAVIVDKMPANALFVGLIHLAFPDARIIHVRRDPVDCCLSCYAERFIPDQPYAYDLGELGRYYAALDTLMRHWASLLPAAVLLTIEHGELLADFDATVGRILRHCGLEWDDRVRSFHTHGRPVRTASLAQVRQPLAIERSRRWRPPDSELEPLLEALGQPRSLGSACTTTCTTI